MNSRIRIGSDDARRWARTLRLGNPYAKSILVAIANYMNEDGVAWPGLTTIAADTDISEETVTNRLRWAESIGAIAIFKCWIDENGIRNKVARGRPTSNEIRFLFDADPETIAARAADATKQRPLRGAALRDHETKSGDEELAPAPGGGSEQPVSTRLAPARGGGSEPVSTRLAPARGGPNLEEEDSEEKKNPPYPPSGGFEKGEVVESFKPFLESYPAPITDMPKALALWSALTVAERTEALTGARGYRSYIEAERRSNRNRAVKDAHRWLRDRLWVGYLVAGKSAEATEQRFSAPMGSPQAAAWDVFYRCCGEIDGIPKYLISATPAGRVARVPREWPPLVGEGTEWKEWPEGAPQFAAWLRRLLELPDVQIRLRTRLIEGKSVRVMRVPGEFPPAKGSNGGMTGVG